MSVVEYKWVWVKSLNANGFCSTCERTTSLTLLIDTHKVLTRVCVQSLLFFLSLRTVTNSISIRWCHCRGGVDIYVNDDDVRQFSDAFAWLYLAILSVPLLLSTDELSCDVMTLPDWWRQMHSCRPSQWAKNIDQWKVFCFVSSTCVRCIHSVFPHRHRLM